MSSKLLLKLIIIIFFFNLFGCSPASSGSGDKDAALEKLKEDYKELVG